MMKRSLRIYKEYQIVPNFILKIFPKVYRTFGNNMTSFYNLQTNEDDQDNRKEILNNPGWKYLTLEKENKKKRD